MSMPRYVGAGVAPKSGAAKPADDPYGAPQRVRLLHRAVIGTNTYDHDIQIG